MCALLLFLLLLYLFDFRLFYRRFISSRCFIAIVLSLSLMLDSFKSSWVIVFHFTFWNDVLSLTDFYFSLFFFFYFSVPSSSGFLLSFRQPGQDGRENESIQIIIVTLSSQFFLFFSFNFERVYECVRWSLPHLFSKKK